MRKTAESAASLSHSAATRFDGALSLETAATPPSFNAVGLHSHWRKGHRWKQAWQRDLWVLLLAGGLPKPLRHVHVEASLRFPQKRQRDEGNFRVILEKACGDALVAGGWLSDDSAGRFSFGRVSFEPERGPHRTRLVVRYQLGVRNESDRT
jgi:hypothetical protein